MRHKIGIIAFLFYAFFTTFGQAQSVEIDYELWAKQAKHVERQLENKNVSESLRKQVAEAVRLRPLVSHAGERWLFIRL